MSTTAAKHSASAEPQTFLGYARSDGRIDVQAREVHDHGHGASVLPFDARRGTVRADCPAPCTPEEAAAFAALVARVYHPQEPAGAELAPHALDEFALVASWFRRKPEERGHTVAAATPWTADAGTAG